MNSTTPLRKSLQLKDGGVISVVGAGGKTAIMLRLARELSNKKENVLATTTTRILRPPKRFGGEFILSSSADDILKKSKYFLKSNHQIAAASYFVSRTQNKVAGFSPETIDRFHASGVFQWIIVEADGAAQRPLKAPAAHEPVIPSRSSLVIGVVGLDSVGKTLSEKNVFRPELFSKITGIPLGSRVTAESIAKAAIHKNGVMKGSPEGAKQILFLNKADIPKGKAHARNILKSIKKFGPGAIEKIIVGMARR